MSDRDKNLLFIVGGILLVVLVIQFGFRNFLAENKEQKAKVAGGTSGVTSGLAE